MLPGSYSSYSKERTEEASANKQNTLVSISSLLQLLIEKETQQRTKLHCLTMNWQYCVYLTLLLLQLSLAADNVSSWAIGFEHLNSVPPYEYGASIILEGDTYYQFYCSPGSGNAQEAP